ncbi:hypothetical protein BaRGS_00024353, partial [Batillaria attramentaria]
TLEADLKAMDALEESLDLAKWTHKTPGNRSQNYHEYQVMRQHKQLTPTSYRYLIQTDAEENPKGVIVENTAKNKDPLKDIGTAELLLKDDKVVGIDLDGDCLEQN